MRFTVTATIEYDVDIEGDVAEELVNYCHEHNCTLDEALWQKQTTDTDFNLYDDGDCTIAESDFSTETIVYEGMNDFDDIDAFIDETADDYGIPKKEIVEIIGEYWEEDEDEDDD